MARFKNIQNAFIAGEISPNASGRTDLKEHFQGCRELLNKIVLPAGGAQRRVGTQFLLDSFGGTAIDEGTRLIPFVTSTGVSKIIAITPGATTISALGMHIIDVATNSITALVDNTVTLLPVVDAPGWEFEGYDSLNLNGASDLEQTHHAQNGDLLFLANEKHCPLILSPNAVIGVSQVWNRAVFLTFINRTAYAGADASITPKLSSSNPPGINRVDNYKCVPYESKNLDTATTFRTLFPAVAGDIVEMLRAGPGTPEDAIFWIGGFLRHTREGITGVAQPVEQAVSFDVEIYKEFQGTGADSNWERADWMLGFPRTLAMFEGRVMYAGGFGRPNKVWGSQIGDLGELMALREADNTDFLKLSNDRPFDFALASSEFNKIQWIIGGKTLAIGTNGAAFVASGPDPAFTLGPLNIDASRQSSIGSSGLQPVRADEADIFVQRDGRTIREFFFNDEEKNFKAINLSVFADHMVFRMAKDRAAIVDPKWKYMSYQQDKNIIWLVDNNGGLSGITRDRDFDVKAWHQHRLGGNLDGEPPKILSIAIVPSPDETHDEIWLVVKRTIDGNEKITIEKMGKQFEIDKVFNSSTDIKDKMVYSDSARLLISTDLMSAISPFYANYEANINATESGGVGSGTGTGAPGITGGRLDLDGPGVKYVDYAGLNNSWTTGFGQGTIEFFMTPNYTGSPAADKVFFELHNTGDSLSRLKLKHTSGGALVFEGADNGGTLFTLVTLASFSPTAATPVHIECKFDSNGSVLFVDGLVVASTTTGTDATRSTIDTIRIGSDKAGTATSDFKIGYFMINTTPVHFADFKPEDIKLTTLQKTFRKFDHLEGETLQLITDGFFDGTKVVAFGKLTFETLPTEIIAGLFYRSLADPLELEAGSIVGSAQSTIKRVDQATIRFDQTIGGKIGPTKDDLQELDFRPSDLPMDDPIPLFEGDKIQKFDASYDRSGRIVVVQDLPFPMTVVSIISRGVTYDG